MVLLFMFLFLFLFLLHTSELSRSCMAGWIWLDVAFWRIDEAVSGVLSATVVVDGGAEGGLLCCGTLPQPPFSGRPV